MDSQCSVHLQPWKVIPAGISKKTGKAYGAFKVCVVDGCKEKPVELNKQEPLDEAISKGIQAPQTAQSVVDERSYRIERQHSQHMALLHFANKGEAYTPEELLKMIDFFMKDLDK